MRHPFSSHQFFLQVVSWPRDVKTHKKESVLTETNDLVLDWRSGGSSVLDRTSYKSIECQTSCNCSWESPDISYFQLVLVRVICSHAVVVVLGVEALLKRFKVRRAVGCITIQALQLLRACRLQRCSSWLLAFSSYFPSCRFSEKAGEAVILSTGAQSDLMYGSYSF